MGLLTWVAVVLGALALTTLIVLVALFLRRSILQRDGGFDMCLRIGHPDSWAGGWLFGVGRYRGENLEWFRTFSVAPRPKRSMRRAELTAVGRRQPDPDEAFELPSGHIVLKCDVAGVGLEVSMTEAAATAFLAWLEAAPPGGPLVE
ncbi:MAG TPA: DUF2550 domain-containing protein [Jiangellaceae bacterium]|nr:DUF2550 domain-containing protein [Jiangellaceae bacterium]